MRSCLTCSMQCEVKNHEVCLDPQFILLTANKNMFNSESSYSDIFFGGDII